MKIIPAIDIIDGKCVRLTKGNYDAKTVYRENPVDMAKAFEDHGMEFLHLVDLDGARSGGIVNRDTLLNIASNTQLKVDFGGGIKREEDLTVAFESGAYKVTVGSVAAQSPEVFLRWIEAFGSDNIILGADCKNRKIATQGWLQNSTIDVIDFIRNYEKLGVREVVCTDIDKDGMLAGTSIQLYKEIRSRSSIHLIASGGVSSLHDIKQLKAMGCNGVIVGKAIYEGRITLKELSDVC